MRQILTILLISIICIDSNGSTYGIMTGHIDSVYYSGIVAGETQYQNQAIAFLCNEFIKTYYPSCKEKIFLELGFSDKDVYKLSYDKFQGEMWENAEHNRPAKGYGIRIIMSQSYNRTESVLRLLEYGINNLAILKQASKDYYALDYYDRPDELTIDSATLINEIQKPINNKIKNTLEIKVFRNLGNVEYKKVNKEYYLQNDKYHFIDFLNKDTAYLEINKIYQIISDYYLGTLIFETDSSGYFYNRETGQLSSKFFIKDKKAAFYFTHTSTDNYKKRIYFEYDTYKEGKRKFIYLTDKLILIQKVDFYEDEFIKLEIEKCTKG